MEHEKALCVTERQRETKWSSNETIFATIVTTFQGHRSCIFWWSFFQTFFQNINFTECNTRNIYHQTKSNTMAKCRHATVCMHINNFYTAFSSFLPHTSNIYSMYLDSISLVLMKPTLTFGRYFFVLFSIGFKNIFYLETLSKHALYISISRFFLNF